mmetsp:Transcript_15031/g.38155  ORF Transcript_15031/g.38155 Transcript_15031/m.38155 type:complete len:204 (+) Transcript_15031:811-1422(+)
MPKFASCTSRCSAPEVLPCMPTFCPTSSPPPAACVVEAASASVSSAGAAALDGNDGMDGEGALEGSISSMEHRSLSSASANFSCRSKSSSSSRGNLSISALARRAARVAASPVLLAEVPRSTLKFTPVSSAARSCANNISSKQSCRPSTQGLPSCKVTDISATRRATAWKSKTKLVIVVAATSLPLVASLPAPFSSMPKLLGR